MASTLIDHINALSSDPHDLILFYEVLVICSTFYLSTKYKSNHSSMYSDNPNAVDMFSSLHAKSIYNSILVATVDSAVNSSISTKVHYVSGKQTS